MTSRPRRILCALAALALAAPAAAATRIGLSLPTSREERWLRDRAAMEAEARKAGVELLVEVADNDAARQASQCGSLLARDVDVLVLAPVDATRAAGIVEAAARAGVRVVSYDRLVTGSAREYVYVSFDGERVGELQGEFLARRVPRGRYVVLEGAPSDHNARLLARGAARALRPLRERGEVRVVLERAVKDWSPGVARRLCGLAAAQHAPIDAVLAPNDATAGGCLEALAAAGLAGKVVLTGQDAEASAARRIAQGTQAMTVFKDTRALARKALEIAAALAAGREVDTRGRVLHNGKRDVPAVLLEPVAVTRENLDVLVESGYLPANAVRAD